LKLTQLHNRTLGRRKYGGCAAATMAELRCVAAGATLIALADMPSSPPVAAALHSVRRHLRSADWLPLLPLQRLLPLVWQPVALGQWQLRPPKPQVPRLVTARGL
jgi:hypothetical protein